MKAKGTILIVDDEPNIRRILQVAFEKEGYRVDVAEDGHSATGRLRDGSYEVVLTDVTMPGMTGYELLQHVKAQSPQTAVVIMTAFGTIPQAVQAIRDGAFEYVPKPFDLESLKKVIAGAAASGGASAIPGQGGKAKAKAFIAESEPMREVFEMVEQVADSRATVLITGESGVGKEVIARSLHTLSGRHDQSFVAVSCAALPESLLESELFGYEKGAFTGAAGSKVGRFELADHGTLFLDEIGEIPMQTQVKLLRVLQEREFEKLGASKPTRVDVRLVTATNRDLRQGVEDGIFRLDLLYRLQVVEIHVPPLRERIDDIVPLANHFLAKFAKENGKTALELDKDAIAVLQSYDWPGNVRELENTMERATVLSNPDELLLKAKLLPNSIRRVA